MSARIVSGFNRERRREIVSLPPEKMRSTATTEPVQVEFSCLNSRKVSKLLTGNGHEIACHSVHTRRFSPSCIPPLDWIGVLWCSGSIKVPFQFISIILVVGAVVIVCEIDEA